jgi:hypothetical protein
LSGGHGDGARSGRIVAAVLVVVWLASLPLPAIEVVRGPTLDGFDVLERGWRGTADGVVSWWANPAFAMALIALWLGRLRLATVLALLASLLALSSFAAALVAGWTGRTVPDFRLGWGFYVWLVACIGLAATCLNSLTKKKIDTKS